MSKGVDPAILSQETKLEIYRKRLEGATLVQLANEYKYSKTTINRIVKSMAVQTNAVVDTSEIDLGKRLGALVNIVIGMRIAQATELSRPDVIHKAIIERQVDAVRALSGDVDRSAKGMVELFSKYGNNDNTPELPGSSLTATDESSGESFEVELVN